MIQAPTYQWFGRVEQTVCLYYERLFLPDEWWLGSCARRLEMKSGKVVYIIAAACLAAGLLAVFVWFGRYLVGMLG